MKEFTNPDFSFDEKKHEYKYKKKKLISVTQIIGHFFEPFKEKKIARRLAKIPKYKNKGMTVKKILAEWKHRRDYGTLVHKQIEDYLLGALDEVKHFENKTKNALMYYTDIVEQLDGYITFPEVRIFSETYGVAGTIDCLIRHTKEGQRVATLVDWKTNKEIHTEGFNGKKSIHPLFDTVDDCSLQKYRLQLTTYAYILETEYDIKVDRLLLAHLKETTVDEYELTYIKEDAIKVLETARIINVLKNKRKRWYKMLSPDQKTELQEISKSPAAFGAFTGMIFNQLIATNAGGSPKDIEFLIKKALDVKLAAKELVK